MSKAVAIAPNYREAFAAQRAKIPQRSVKDAKIVTFTEERDSAAKTGR